MANAAHLSCVKNEVLTDVVEVALRRFLAIDFFVAGASVPEGVSLCVIRVITIFIILASTAILRIKLVLFASIELITPGYLV